MTSGDIPIEGTTLDEYLREHPQQGFKPLPFINKHGNLLEWYFTNAEGYAEPVHVDGMLVGMLIRSFKTKEVVGVKICLEAAKGS